MNDRLLTLLLTQAWQILLLAMIVAAATKIVAKNRPHLAHAMWILVLIKCVTPPVWSSSFGLFSQLQTLSEHEIKVALVVSEPAEFLPEAPITAFEADAEQEPLISETCISVESAIDPLPDLNESSWPDAEITLAEEPADDVSIEFVAAAPPIEQTVTVVAEIPIGPSPWPRRLLISLSVGAMLTLMIIVVRCVRCLRLIHRHRTTEFDDALNARLQQLAKQLKLRRVPRIVVSDVLFGPAVLGLLRHTIVLPKCLLSRSFLPERTSQPAATCDEPMFQSRIGQKEITASNVNVLSFNPQSPQDEHVIAVDVLRAIDHDRSLVAASCEALPGRQDLPFLDPILAHELLHIRRGDLRFGMLQVIAQSLWWFHPAVWFANRWLSREAERCCDEQVIAELGCTPGQYARSLLAVIESKHTLQPIPVFPGMKPVEITTQRMERIMSLKNGLNKRTPLWCWLAVAALAIVVLPGALAKSLPEEAASEPIAQTQPAEATAANPNVVVATKYTFEGNEFWTAADLKNEIAGLPEVAAATESTSENIQKAEIEAIKVKYMNVGFFDVNVSIGPRPSTDSSRTVRHFSIVEGVRYKIREIRFEGNHRIATADLEAELSVSPGDQWNSYALAKDVNKCITLPGSAARVNPVPHFLEQSGFVDLVFEIDEDSETSLIPVPRFIQASSDPLVKVAWDVREVSRNRLLMADQQSPWQIMNGLMALRKDFAFRDGDKVVNALEWIQSNPTFVGTPWFQKTEHGGQPNPTPAPVYFDDHAQQFVAALAMNDVPLEATFPTADGSITMNDMIRHLQMTVNEKRLSPWTLYALCHYLPLNAKWDNAKGEAWSIERLVRATMRSRVMSSEVIDLFAIAYARNQYTKTGQPLKGVWLEADDRIKNVATRNGNNGTFEMLSYPQLRMPHLNYQRYQPNFYGSASPSKRLRLLKAEQKQLELQLLDIEKHRIKLQYLRPYSEDVMKSASRESLLFGLMAFSDDQLKDERIRRSIESAANDLLVHWNEAQTQSPFHESVMAMSLYLDRVAAMAPVENKADNLGQQKVVVKVKGLVQKPGDHEFTASNDSRVLDAIRSADGPADKVANSVFVIRNRSDLQGASIIQLSLDGLERGVDPNIHIITGDKVVLENDSLFKQPIAADIRTADSFVLSSEAPIEMSDVVVSVASRPITVAALLDDSVAEFMLKHLPELTDKQRRTLLVDTIKRQLPTFVFDDILRQYFHIVIPNNLLDERAVALATRDEEVLKAIRENSQSGGAISDEDLKSLVGQIEKLRTAHSATKGILYQTSLHRIVAQYTAGLPKAIADQETAVHDLCQQLLIHAELRTIISLDLEGITLQDFLRELSRKNTLNVVLKTSAVESAGLGNPTNAITYHCQNLPLKDAINAIIEPLGLDLQIEHEVLYFRVSDQEKFWCRGRSNASPSYCVLGLAKNHGWHVLEKEIHLRDVFELEDSTLAAENIHVAITNPDILNGKSNPVSMSLRLLLDDSTGKLNRVVNDRDIITLMTAESYQQVSTTTTLSTEGTLSKSQNGAATNPIDQPRKALNAVESRVLSTKTNTPWQIMQSVMAFGKDAMIDHNGTKINTLDWITTGPTFKQEPWPKDEPWFLKTEHGGRAHPYNRPYEFEGHANQFTAWLAMCKLPLETVFQTPDGPITMQDLIKHAQMTVNEKEEVSWTLLALVSYLPLDAEWTNAAGEEWSIERLVKMETNANMERAPCGGTCGLFTLAVARNAFLKTGKSLSGVWLEADEKVNRYVETAKAQQNADGQLSAYYFRNRSEQPVAQALLSRGNLLQFLMAALPDERLKEAWVTAAIEENAKELEKRSSGKIGPAEFYPAASALRIYLDRVQPSVA